MWWRELGQVENECTSHNFSLFAIFLPKIIKFGGNLTKFRQKQFCTVFLRHGVVCQVKSWQACHTSLVSVVDFIIKYLVMHCALLPTVLAPVAWSLSIPRGHLCLSFSPHWSQRPLNIRVWWSYMDCYYSSNNCKYIFSNVECWMYIRKKGHIKVDTSSSVVGAECNLLLEES